MNAILDMFSATFDFFVDIGNRIDFFGLNLWDISLYVFVIALVFRFLFPFIFNESGKVFFGLPGSGADTYKDEFYLQPYKEKPSGSLNGNRSAGMLKSGK